MTRQLLLLITILGLLSIQLTHAQDDTQRSKTFNDQGIALQAQGKNNEAEISHREAVRLQPDNANYHNWLGGALYNQKCYREAEAEYREAVRLAPNVEVYQKNVKLAMAQVRANPPAPSPYPKQISFWSPSVNGNTATLYVSWLDAPVAPWAKPYDHNPQRFPAARFSFVLYAVRNPINNVYTLYGAYWTAGDVPTIHDTIAVEPGSASDTRQFTNANWSALLFDQAEALLPIVSLLIERNLWMDSWLKYYDRYIPTNIDNAYTEIEEYEPTSKLGLTAFASVSCTDPDNDGPVDHDFTNEPLIIEGRPPHEPIDHTDRPRSSNTSTPSSTKSSPNPAPTPSPAPLPTITKRQKYEQKAKAFIKKQLAGQIFKRAVVATLAVAGISVSKTTVGIVFGIIWPTQIGDGNEDFGFSSKDRSLYILKKPSYPSHQP